MKIEKWYFSLDEDESVGPLSREEIQSRLEAGDITADTYVWRHGLADWIPLGESELVRKSAGRRIKEWRLPLALLAIPVLVYCLLAFTGRTSRSGYSRATAWRGLSATESPTHATVSASSQTIAEQELPELTPRRDTTLSGYDVALSMDEFKARYADIIKSCKEASYPDDGEARKIKLPITVCTLKEHGATAKFYNGRMYRFDSEATSKRVKIRLATEELEKKAGSKAMVSTFDFGPESQTYCAASVDFADGRASIVSEFIPPIVRTRGFPSLEDFRQPCSETTFMNVDWESIIYTNKHVVEALEIALIQERDSAERKTAGEIKF
jgi:hypothetical protein